MNEFLNYKGEIKIHQYGILNGEEIIADAKFICVNNFVFLEVIGETPFKDFLDTQSRFTAIIEFEDNNIYEIFELTILPDSEMYEFEVIHDNEYFGLQKFLVKHELEKELNQDNKKSQPIKDKKI